jgi:hypothetical protein
MYSYHVRRRNFATKQHVYRAMRCEPRRVDLIPTIVSKSYLGHLRGKRSHSVVMDGKSRILVEFSRGRNCADVNEVASVLCASRGRYSAPIRGPAWILINEESWLCVWQSIAKDGTLGNRISPEICGEYIVETVKQMSNGCLGIWHRWLLRDDADYGRVVELVRSGLSPSNGEHEDVRMITLPKEAGLPTPEAATF